MEIVSVEYLSEDHHGFAKLASIAEAGRVAGELGTSVLLDLTMATFISGPMLASLGATIIALQRSGVRVEARIPRGGELGNYLRRIGFTAYAGGGAPDAEDIQLTSIPYAQFSVLDTETTRSYISRRILDRREIEGLALTQKVENVLWEAHENSREHGSSAYVFFAGQRFPKAEHFMIQLADIGMGFRQRINGALGKTWPAAKCLEWAMLPRRTTRTHGPPGGLGLKVMRRFLQQNGGTLTVASDAAVWQESPDGVSVYRLDFPLLATSVTIDVRVSEDSLSTGYFDAEGEDGVIF